MADTLSRPYGQRSTLGGLYIYTIYDPRFTERIKQEIPAQERQYDSDLRRWYISQRYASEAEAIAHRIWPMTWKMAPEPDHQKDWDEIFRPPPGFHFGDFFNRRYQRETEGQPGAGYRQSPGTGSAGPGARSDCGMLYVTDNAPPEVIRAAYRALSKLYHPDAGGSANQMQLLNAAYERLRKAGKA